MVINKYRCYCYLWYNIWYNFFVIAFAIVYDLSSSFSTTISSTLNPFSTPNIFDIKAIFNSSVATLALGSRPRQGGCKVAGQEGIPRATFHAPESAKECEGMNPHTLKWTPRWELESQWTPKSSERNCRGQNPLAWKFIYIIGKPLKPRCLKWAHIAHLDIWNTSHDQKKGWESNWQFDSQPLKVGNQPNLLAFSQRVTYRWNDLDKGYNFSLNLIVIKGLHVTLCTPKVTRVPIVRISGHPLENPKTKIHLDVALVERCKVYYKGEGGDFLQVRVVISLVSSNCPWFVLAPKVLQLCINHLVLVLCKFVWIVKAC